MNKNEILKKRSSNFTHTEVDLLQLLVTKYWDQLKSKKSDPQTWKQKNACWEKLTDEFNSQNFVMENRSTNVLRKKWENCKKTVKSKVCNKKKDLEASSWIDTVPDKSSSPDDDTVLKWDDYLPALLKTSTSKPLFITIPSDIYSAGVSNGGNETLSKEIIIDETMRSNNTPFQKKVKTSGTIINKKLSELADEKKKTSLLKSEKLKLEMLHLQEEHDLKIQILQCELAIKKKQLEML